MIKSEKLGIRDLRRKLQNYGMLGVLTLLSGIAILPLVLVFIYIFQKGFPALNLDFFISLPKPVGEAGGGMANAIIGSATVVGLASLIGIPWGVGIGVFLSEYPYGKTPKIIRFTADLLASIPSIVIGLFVYVLLVAPFKGFSAYAGGAALAIIMIPTVARTTEEILKLVPNHVREAGLALGLPRWKVILRIVFRGSYAGIATAILLGLARIAGETAPLLFTAFTNRFWSRGLNQPTSTLPVQIYNYAISPYEDWHNQAWAGALLLIVFVFLLKFSTWIFITRRGQQ